MKPKYKHRSLIWMYLLDAELAWPSCSPSLTTNSLEVKGNGPAVYILFMPSYAGILFPMWDSAYILTSWLITSLFVFFDATSGLIETWGQQGQKAGTERLWKARKTTFKLRIKNKNKKYKQRTTRRKKKLENQKGREEILHRPQTAYAERLERYKCTKESRNMTGWVKLQIQILQTLKEVYIEKKFINKMKKVEKKLMKNN